jgi:hypothetical protein
MCDIHIIEYLAIKRKILIHATTLMNLENIRLSEKKPVTKYQILYYSIYMTNP